jgi:glutamate synthase domain-containing protein 1
MYDDTFSAERFREEAPFRILGGCGLSGIIDRSRARFSGEEIIRSMACMDERSNGLGAGYAVYGLFPDFAEHFAFQLMYTSQEAKAATEDFLFQRFEADHAEEIPTRPTPAISDAPLLHRYFVKPKEAALDRESLSSEDMVMKTVMTINHDIDGAFVISSGRDMAGFKAVGFPVDVARFYRLDEYEASIWIGHGRFPTNTPGWWGGAHPFCLLEFSIVHNGEISSYGINKRYLEMHGYYCSLGTDTEVLAYIFDLLVRRHHLPIELACKVVAPPFWSDLEKMDPADAEVIQALRRVYGSAAANGPFSIVVGFGDGIVALNDRIKLRPLVAARDGDRIYVASEEAAIRTICSEPENVWRPEAGEPVIARYYDFLPEDGATRETTEEEAA